MNNKVDIIRSSNRVVLFEIKKEDISDEPFLDLETIMDDFISRNAMLLKSEKNSLLDLLFNNITKKLSSLNIQSSQITNLAVYKKGILKITVDRGGKQEVLSFDINQDLDELEKNPNKNLFLGEAEQLKQKREQEQKKTVKILEQTDKILGAMKYIFRQNEKEWFGELNDEDVVTIDRFGPELKGKNLKQLQKEFNRLIDQTKNVGDLNTQVPPKMRDEILRQRREYLEMLMGIGDEYEGGAAYLTDTDTNFEANIDLLVDTYSNKEILSYLARLHAKIDDNNWQSDSVEKAYKVMAFTLHRKIYEKIINQIPNKEVKQKDIDKDLVTLAKIITGKEINGVEMQIDDNLRDPDLAQKILITIFTRENGVVDRLQKEGKINIDDPEIKDKNPSALVNNLRKEFVERYGEGETRGRGLLFLKYFENSLKAAGYDDVLNIPEDKSYSELSFYQKTKLSVLNRVLKKMKEGKNFEDRSVERINSAMTGNIGQAFDVRHYYMLEDFAGLFNSVAKDYIEELASNLDDEFTDWGGLWGKDSEEMGLEGVQAEAFDLFQDIRGAGLIDFSDVAIARAKTAGKFVGMVAIGMAVPYIALPSATLLAQGAAAGAAATVASMALDPHGYDTVGEALTDISTDLALGTITGALGGGLSATLESQVGRGLLKEGKFIELHKYVKGLRPDDLGKSGKAIYFSVMATDLTFLGLGPEIWRQKEIREYFHNKDILEEK